MPWYRIRLRIAGAPVSVDQRRALEAAGVLVWGRGDALSVTLEAINAGDPAGAVARAQNVVLNLVAGEVVAGDFEVTEAPPRVPRRRRRRPAS